MKTSLILILLSSSIILCSKENIPLDPRYNDLVSNHWKLDYLSLNGTRLLDYPYNLTSRINVMSMNYPAVKLRGIKTF
jgi:hypothetical protein